MKFQIAQPELKQALLTVGHGVPSRPTLPILQNLLFTAENNYVKVSASNLELGISYILNTTPSVEGEATIPAKLLSDLVSGEPAAPMEIVVDQNYTAHIKGYRSAAQIRGMEPSEFPKFPQIEGNATTVTIDAALLKEMISEVAFAAAPDDDSRPVLSAVYVQVQDERLILAAADSFRLAFRSAEVPGVPDVAHILVPAKTLRELGRILPLEGSVEMLVTERRNQVLFHTTQIDLVSRLMEGTFPNFRAIMPKDNGQTWALVDTKEFAAAMKSAAPFARESSNITRIQFSGGASGELEKGFLTVEASTEDVGSNVSTIGASIEGSNKQVILNVKYVTDALSAISSDEVVFGVGSMRPATIKPAGGSDLLYVIMPMETTR